MFLLDPQKAWLSVDTLLDSSHKFTSTPLKIGACLIHRWYTSCIDPLLFQQFFKDQATILTRVQEIMCSRPVIGYRWQTTVSISPFFPLGQASGTWKEPNYNPCWGGWTQARLHPDFNSLSSANFTRTWKRNRQTPGLPWNGIIKSVTWCCS